MRRPRSRSGRTSFTVTAAIATIAAMAAGAPAAATAGEAKLMETRWTSVAIGGGTISADGQTLTTVFAPSDVQSNFVANVFYGFQGKKGDHATYQPGHPVQWLSCAPGDFWLNAITGQQVNACVAAKETLKNLDSQVSVTIPVQAPGGVAFGSQTVTWVLDPSGEPQGAGPGRGGPPPRDGGSARGCPATLPRINPVDPGSGERCAGAEGGIAPPSDQVVTFLWGAVSVPAGNLSYLYNWHRIDAGPCPDDENMPFPDRCQYLPSNTNTISHALRAGDRYRWRVKAICQDGNGRHDGDWSSWTEFWTRGTLEPVELQMPANGALIPAGRRGSSSANVQFSWSEPECGASYYRLKIFDSENGTQPQTNLQVGGPNATVGLSRGSTYWWEVIAVTSYGNATTERFSVTLAGGG